MSKVKPISAQDAALLGKIDALIGEPETPTELASELESLRVDPAAIQDAVFARVRSAASEKYSSRGVAVPALMRDALRQLKPPSPEEALAKRTERIGASVHNFLATVKNAGARFAEPLALAPAYRNKQDGESEEDAELLRCHQEELDREGDA